MYDPRMRNLANILVNYSVGVKPGDLVGITLYGSILVGYPLFPELLREILRAGGYPHFYLLPNLTEELDFINYTEANQDQMGNLDRFYEMVSKEFDCDIYFGCESNSRRLSKVDPDRIQQHRRAYADLAKTYLKRASHGELRWVYSILPTSGYAQDAEMSLEEYEDFVYAATYPNTHDPIAKWKEIAHNQKRIVEWMVGKKKIELKGDHVDLSFSIDGRPFVSCDGRLNMPDGEIFTGPVEDSAEGWIESTFPAIHGGVDVGQVALRFDDGQVTHAQAKQHQDHLLKALDTDDGARRLGEFGIGTNERINVFTKKILLDEKIAGTIHVALGIGYPESGSQNESGLHWDFLCDMRDGGQIIVDDQVIYESGKFKI
jgi:aminopeptidase